MSGHTPGRWEVFPSEWDSTLYVMPEGQWEGRGGPDTVAVIQSNFMHGEANARLIAVAPELLFELQQAVSQMKMAADCLEAGRTDEALLHVCSLMRTKRAAIAKATGAQP
jgi:hypothetical protein